MGSPKSSHQRHPRCWMCKKWNPEDEPTFPPPKTAMGNCPESNGQTSAYSDKIIYCQSGKLDPQRIQSFSDEHLAQQATDLQENELVQAKARAAGNMSPGGYVLVGRAGLTKREIDLLIECGFAERRAAGFHSRLFIS